MSRRQIVVLLIAVLVAAFALRLGRLLEERQGPLGLVPVLDEGTYDRWALRIAQGVQPDEVPFQAPGQAYHLATWHGLFPDDPDVARDLARLVGILLGVGTVALTFLVGRRAGGPRVGLIAAGLVAIYRPLIHIEPTLLRDGAGTFCTMLSLLLLVLVLDARRIHKAVGLASLLGISLGAGALVRENLLLIGMLVVLGLGSTALRREVRRTRAAATAAVALGMILPLAPTLVSNYRLEGAFSPLPTWNGGVVFYTHNRRENLSGGYIPAPYVASAANADREAEGFRLEAERREGRALHAHEISSFWLREGLREVREEPLLYLLRIAARTRNFLLSGIGVHARDLRADAAESLVLSLPSPGFGFLAALGLAGMLMLPRRGAGRTVALVTVALAATVIPVAFVTRYRLPAVPGVTILAVLGLRSLALSARGLWRMRGAGWAPSRSRLAIAITRRDRDAVRVLLGTLALGLGVWLHTYEVHYDPSSNLVNRSIALRSLGRWEEAAVELEKIPRPGLRALKLLGYVRLKVAAVPGPNAKPSAQRAREAYTLAVQKERDCTECWAGLALANSMLGEREHALNAIRQATRLDPKNAEYRKLEARLLDR